MAVCTSVPGVAIPESSCTSARPCLRRSWTSCRGRPSIASSIDTAAITGRAASVAPSSFAHGLCSTNLSREPTRHRRLSEGTLRSSSTTWASAAVCVAVPWPMPTKCATGASTRIWRRLLIKKARRLYSGEHIDVELQQSVYALDSTTIDLCLNLFPWARFRSTKAAIKLHTLLDLRGPIPSFIHITDGRCHDVNALDMLVVEAGSLLRHGSWLPGLLAASTHSIRLAPTSSSVPRKDLRLLVRYVSQPVDRDTGLMQRSASDDLDGFYSRKDFPDKLRVVRFYDSDTGSTNLVFLTNHLLLPALTICATVPGALAGRTVLQVDQAASANQALLWKLDERSARLRFGSRCASTCWWRSSRRSFDWTYPCMRCYRSCR